jgi:type VI secretion system secreted protein Hcp
MAADYFLKFDDKNLAGESTDSKHKDEIDVMSFSWGETQTASFGAGGGGGAGKVNMQDFHFTMRYNKASPTLMLACATGQHIKKATLVARKAGGKQEEYLTINFSDCLVSSYQTGGSQGGDPYPTDQISIAFSKIEIDYKVQDDKGAMKQGPKVGYDLAKNAKV